MRGEFLLLGHLGVDRLQRGLLLTFQFGQPILFGTQPGKLLIGDIGHRLHDRHVGQERFLGIRAEQQHRRTQTDRLLMGRDRDTAHLYAYLIDQGLLLGQVSRGDVVIALCLSLGILGIVQIGFNPGSLLL